VLEEVMTSDLWDRERDSLRLPKTLDTIAADVKRIPRELADAREAIWTPDMEKPKTEAKLWTPEVRS
jgi:hypothetical protein